MKKKILIVLAILLAFMVGCDLMMLLVARQSEEETGIDAESLEEINTLIRGDRTDEALKLLEKEDEDSAEVYYLKEIAYLKDGSDEANEKLTELYRDAADRWPEWQHMQKMAGLSAMLEGNYQSAAYFLLKAVQLDEEDAETWYYLGVLSYHEGDYDDMRMYFEEALERDLSESLQQEMLWYAEQVGDRDE